MLRRHVNRTWLVKPAVLAQQMQMHINVYIHVNYAGLTAGPGPHNW